MEKARNLKGKIIVFIITITSLIGCNKNYQIELLLEEEIGVINYEKSKIYDTKISYSDSILLVLNYDLGHSNFYASTASLKLLKYGKTITKENQECKKIETIYYNIQDSLNLEEISIEKLIYGKINIKNSNKIQIKKINENILVKLSYEDTGITELIINKKGREFKQILSKNIFPSSPIINMYDINGDSNKDLFIFYPCNDYWDSKCYRVVVYDISSFL